MCVYVRARVCVCGGKKESHYRRVTKTGFLIQFVDHTVSSERGNPGTERGHGGGRCKMYERKEVCVTGRVVRDLCSPRNGGKRRKRKFQNKEKVPNLGGGGPSEEEETVRSGSLCERRPERIGNPGTDSVGCRTP